MNHVSPNTSYVEVLPLSVTTFGYRACSEVKLKDAINVRSLSDSISILIRRIPKLLPNLPLSFSISLTLQSHPGTKKKPHENAVRRQVRKAALTKNWPATLSWNCCILNCEEINFC